jgi:hypothetical protein
VVILFSNSGGHIPFSILTRSDVLEVLLAEYRFALVRRRHRRVEIDDLVREAKHRLYRERQDPTGKTYDSGGVQS